MDSRCLRTYLLGSVPKSPVSNGPAGAPHTLQCPDLGSEVPIPEKDARTPGRSD